MTFKDKVTKVSALKADEQQWFDDMAKQMAAQGYISFQVFMDVQYTDPSRTQMNVRTRICVGETSNVFWTGTGPVVDGKIAKRRPFNFGHMETYIVSKGHKARLYRGPECKCTHTRWRVLVSLDVRL